MRILKASFKHLVLVFVLIICSCNAKIKNVSSECKAFATLIKNEWTFNKSTSTYYFKGNPEFWYDSKYFVESCLMGKTRKDIIEMFGTPSKDFKFVKFSYITYCMEESCLQTVKSDGMQIKVFFDSTGVVNQSLISPPIQKRNYNH